MTAALARHELPEVPKALLVLAASLVAALVVQSVQALAPMLRPANSRQVAGRAHLVQPGPLVEAVKDGPQAGEVTVWFRLGAPEGLIRNWAQQYELTELRPNLLWRGHIYRLPSVEVKGLEAGLALVRFPAMMDGKAINDYLKQRHLTVVNWETAELPSGRTLRHRLAVVSLPHIELHLEPVADRPWIYRAMLPTDLGLTEADLQQLVASKASGYEFLSWDPATGELLLRKTPPPAPPLPYVKYEVAAQPTRVVLTPQVVPAPAVPVAPATPQTVQTYVQFRAGTQDAEVKRVLAKFGLSAASSLLAVGSFAPDKVNGMLQLMSDEPSVECVSLRASPCSVNQMAPATARTNTATATGTTSTTAAAVSTSTSTAPPLAPTATLPAPSGLQATAADGHVTLGWQPVTGATGYRIYRQQAGGAWGPAWQTQMATFTDTGGTPGTTYAYRVSAVTAAAAEGRVSAPVVAIWVKASSAPQILKSLPVESQVMSGRVHLEVTARTGDGRGTADWRVQGSRATLDLGSAPIHESAFDRLAWSAILDWDSRQVPDGTYNMTVSVADGAGNPAMVSSRYRIQNGPPSAPSGFKAVAGPAGVMLSWAQPVLAAGAYYRLSRDGQKLVDLAADRRGYLDVGAGPGQHSYALLLVDGSGQLSQTVSAQVTVSQPAQAMAPSTPALSVLTPSGERLKPEGRAPGRLLLVAELPAGETLKSFQLSLDGQSWTDLLGALACIENCSQDWQTPGQDGRYQLRALANRGLSSALFSLIVMQGPQLAAPPQPSASLGPEGVSLNWQAPTGVFPAAYALYRDEGQGWHLLDWVTRTSYLDRAAQPRSRLSYRVTAVDSEGGEGAASAPVVIEVPEPARLLGGPAAGPVLSAPSGLKAHSAPGQVSLSWDAVPGATDYVVERAWSAAGPFEPLAVVASTLYLDRAPALGGLAHYRVRALVGDASGEASSEVTTLLMPAGAPQPIELASNGLLPQAPPEVSSAQAVVEADGVRLSWAAQSGQVSYRVWRYDPQTLTFELAASGLQETSFLDTGLSPGKGYGYVVTAVDAFGQESGYSAASWVDVPDLAAASGSPLNLVAPLQAVEGSSLIISASGGGLDHALQVSFQVAPQDGEFASIAELRPFGSSHLGGASLGQQLDGSWAAIWNTNGLTPGRYNLRLRWTDSLGQVQEMLQALRLEGPLARGPPSSGLSLRATPLAGGVSLSWNNPSAREVQLLRSAGSPDGPFEVITQTSGQSYEDRHLIPSLSYSYWLETPDQSSQLVSAVPLPATIANGSLSVELPPASVSRLALDVAANSTAPALPNGLSLVGSAYSIEATSLATGAAVHLLNEAASITFNLPASASGSLNLYHWEGSQWQLESSAFDSSAHTLSAHVDHFSLFAVAAGSPSAPSSGSQAGPPLPSPAQFAGGGTPTRPPSPPHLPPLPTLQVAPDGEVVSLRTATSKVYRNPNGSFRQILSSGPINFLDASGAWRSIDTTLVGVSDGSGDVVSAAAPLQVRLPQDISQRPVQVTANGASISMRLVGAQTSVLSASGSQGGYVSVLPGVDASFQAAPRGIRENLVLNSRPVGTVSFTYQLDLSPGLELLQQANGSINAVDSSGKLQMVIPSPLLMEPITATGMGAQSNQVAVTLAGAAGHYRLTYTPDAAWLTDPKRLYPVVLDPSVTMPDGVNAYICSSMPNTSFQDIAGMPVGIDINGCVYRMLIPFGQGWPIDGGYASSATLNVLEGNNYGHCCSGIWAHEIGAGWSAGGMTWNTQPGFVGPAPSTNTSCQGCWLSWDVTQTIRDWGFGTNTDLGFTLTGYEQACCANDVELYSNATASPPYVQINYDTYTFATQVTLPSTNWVPSGGNIPVLLQLQNTGTAAWYPGQERLSHRWADGSGNLLTNFDPRVDLPYQLNQGDQVTFNLSIPAPPNGPSSGSAAPLQLQFAMVNEMVFWFYSMAWGSGAAIKGFGGFNIADESVTISGRGLPQVILAQPAGVITIPLTLTNRSPYRTWNASNTNDLTRVGMRRYRTSSGAWVDVSQSPLAARTYLPQDVGPGGTVNVNAVLQAPGDPGDYWFHIDLFRETPTWSAWFEDRSNQPLDVHVRVVAPGDGNSAQVPVTQNDGSQLGVNSSNGYLTLYASDLSIAELGTTSLRLTRAFNGVNAGLPANGTTSSNATYGVGWTFNFQRSVQLGSWGGNVARFSAGLYTDIRGKSWPLTWNPGRGVWEDAAGDRTVSGPMPVDLLQRSGGPLLMLDPSSPNGHAVNLETAGAPSALIFPGGRVPTQQSGTIELWFKQDFDMSTDPYARTLIGDPRGNFMLTWNPSTPAGHARQFCFTTRDNDTGASDSLCSGSTSTWAQGWHQVAISWAQQGSTYTKNLYLDGLSAAAASTPAGVSPSGDLYIDGFDPTGVANWFNTWLTMLRIESQPLNTATIQADYSNKTETGDANTLYLGTFVDSVNSTWGRYTLTNPDQSQEDYDPSTGRLLAERDRVGNQIDYVWDTTGRISQIVDHQLPNRMLSFSYNGGNITVTDPGGRTVTYTVNASGDLVSVTKSNQVPDPLTGAVTSQPITTSYTYLPGHALQQITDPRGSTTTIGYQGYQQAVLADRPIAYYQLNDTGASAANSVVVRHDGVINGAVTLGAPGFAGGDGDSSMSFNNSGYISVADNSLLHPSAVSVEAWIYKKADVAWQRIASGGSYPNNNFQLIANSAGGIWFGIYLSTTSSAAVATPNPIPLNQWVHVVGTWNGATVSLYVNGVLVPTTANGGAMQAGSGGLGIGADANGGSPWNGRLADVALYNYALSNSQVTNHYGAGSRYRSVVLADTPVAFYRLDEGSGTVATDTASWSPAGAINGGVIRSAPGLLTTDPNTAMTFDGSTGYVSAAGLYQLNAITAETWIYVTNNLQNGFIVGQNPVNQDWELFLENRSGSATLVWRAGAYQDLTAPAPSANAWHHVAATQSGSTAALYVDGVQVASTNTLLALGHAAGNLEIGRYNSGYYFSGKIAEVAIYDYALTSTQVQTHFGAAAGSLQNGTDGAYVNRVLGDQAVGYWRLDETSLSSPAADRSGHGNNGTYSGGVRFSQTGALASDPDPSVTLDGSSGNVRIPASATLNVAGAFTLEAWINKSAAVTGPILEYNNGNGPGVHLWNWGSWDALFANVIDTAGNGHYIQSASGLLATGQWYHVALTYDGANATLYINGQQVARSAIGSITPQTSYDFYVGKRPSGTPAFFSGSIDEAAVYGYALSPAQLLAHYSTGIASMRRVQSVQDARGNTVVSLSYNDYQAITTVTNGLGQKSYYTFQKPGGRTVSYTDPAGNTTTFNWDPSAAYRLLSTTDPSGVTHARLINAGAPVGQQGQTLIEDTSAQPADTLSDYIVGGGVLPAGAQLMTANESWTWDTSVELRPGVATHVSTPYSQMHQHYFQGANGIVIPAGATATQWVYLQLGTAAPLELMVQFFADGNWEHRAIWGSDVLSFGAFGTPSRRWLGTVPPAGTWVPLQIPMGPADPNGIDVGGRTLTGVAFTLFGGGGNVWWGPLTFDSPPTAVSDPQRSVTRYAYDQFNDQIAAVDPNGIATITDYDAGGLPRQVSIGVHPAPPALLLEDCLSYPGCGFASNPWSLESLGPISASTGASSTVHAGLGSLSQTQSGSVGASDLNRIIGGFDPGTYVRVSVWVQVSGSGAGGAMLQVDDSLSPSLASRRTAFLQPPAGSWAQLSVPFVVDSSGQLRARLWQQNFSGTTLWSDLKVEDLTPAPDVTFQRSRVVYTTDFEQSGDRSLWLTYAPASTALDMPQDPSKAHGGQYSAHVSATVNNASDRWYRDFTVAPGVSYHVSVWARTVASGSQGGPGGVHLWAHNMDGSLNLGGPGAASVQTQGQWQLLTLDTPAWYGTLRLEMVAENFRGDAWFDDFTAQSLSPTGPSNPGVAQYSQVLADSPYVYFHLNDIGNTVYDSSGLGNTARWYGGVSGSAPGFVSGDGAVSFDGSTGYVSAPGLYLPNSITAEAWIYVTNNLQNGFIVGQNPVNQDWELFLENRSGSATLVWRTSSCCSNDLTAPAPSANAWHHVAATQSGSTATLYVDGVQVASSSSLPALGHTPGNLEIGRYNSGYYFSGKIDDVAVYSTALPGARVQAHFSAATGSSAYWQAVLADTPQAYYRLEEAAAAVADSSGNGNRATWYGSVLGGMPGLITNWGDTAMSFDGSSSEVDTTYTQTSVTAYSVEAWLKTTDGGVNRSIVEDRGGSYNAGPGKSLTLGLNFSGTNAPGSPFFILDSDNVAVGVWSPKAINDGQVHHLVGTWSGASGSAVAPSQFTLYVDGTAVAVNQLNSGSVTAPLSGLGGMKIARHDAWNTFLAGTIGQVAVYGSALSAARVQAHFTAGNKYLATVLADAPLAYYRLIELAQLVADGSGRGVLANWLGGVSTGQPGLLSGSRDPAMTFDGSTGYVQSPSLTPLQGGNARTVELWFKTTSAGQQNFIDSGAINTLGQAFQIGLTQSGGVSGNPVVNTPGVYVAFWGSDVYLPGLNLADGNAHHLAVTLTGSSLYVYVDGQTPSGLVWNNSTWTGWLPQPFNLPLATNTAANPLCIGHARSGIWGTGSTYFSGTIDEVAVYDHVLPAARIEAHYAAGWQGATSGTAAAIWTAVSGGGVGNLPARKVSIRATTTLADVGDVLPVQTLRSGASYVLSAWLSSSVANTTVDFSLHDGSGNPLPMDQPSTCTLTTTPTLCEKSLTYKGADYAPTYLTLLYGGQGARDVYLSHPLVALAAERHDYSANGRLLRVYDIFGHEVRTDSDPSGLYPVRLVTRVSTNYGDVVLGDSPQAYWRLDDQPGTTTAADSSGGGNQGALNGGVTAGMSGLLVGDHDTAMSFDGSTGYVQIPYAAASNASTFSVEAWARVTGGAGTYRSVVTSRDGSGTGAVRGYILYAGADDHWWFWLGSGTAGSSWVTLQGPAVVLNQVAHLVGTWSGGVMSFYVNGSLVASTSTGFAANTVRPLRIGAGNTESTPQFYFPGVIHQVAVYGGTLSRSQIQRHYQAGLAQAATTYSDTVLNDQPTGFWKLGDSATDSTAANASSSGLAGSFHSGITAGLPGATADGDPAMGFNNQGYISVADSSVLHPASAISLEAWVYKTADSNWQRVVAGGSYPNQAYYLQADNAGNICGAVIETGGGAYTPCIPLPLNQWVYLVVTYDSVSGMKFYKNGALQFSGGSNPGNIITGSGGLGIGADFLGYNPWNGHLADVALYGQTLTAAQVLRHYQAGLGQTALSANSYQSQVMSDAPSGYWRLNEPSGSLAVDQSGSGNNGSYVGGVSLGQVGALPSDAGRAAGFDGSGGYVALPSSSLNGAFTAWSAEAWVKPTAISGWPRVLSDNYVNTGVNNPGYELAISYDGNAYAAVAVGPSNSALFAGSSGGQITVGRWHHLAATWDGSSLRLYIDGTVVMTASGSGAINASPQGLNIGRMPGSSTSFNGSIDEVAIYNYALPASRVLAHYRAAGWAHDLVSQPTYNVVGQMTSSSEVSASQTITNQRQLDSWGRVTAQIRNFVAGGPSDAQTNVRTGFRYDLNGNLTDSYEQAQTAGQWVITHIDYDANGNKLDQVQNCVTTTNRCDAAIGPAQNVMTRWQYDALNRVVDELDPQPGCTASGCATVDRRSVYDMAGHLSQKIENFGGTQDVSQANVTTNYAYDPDGRLTDTFQPVSGPVTQLSSVGQVGDHRTYDVLGRLIRETKAASALSFLAAAPAQADYTLDPGGRVTDVTGPGTGTSAVRVVAHTDYDDLGRPLTGTVDRGGLNAVTRHVYDPRGAQHDFTPATQQLPGGLQTSSYVDLDGHVVEVVKDEIVGVASGPDVNVTTLTAYDCLGRATDVTNARGVVTHTDYDALDRVLDTVLDPSGLNLTTSYLYDLAGNKAQTISARDGGPRVDLTQYDALHRPTATIQNYVSGVAVDFQTNVTTALTYDQGGRVLTTRDPLGRVTVTWYDMLGRKIRDIQNCVGSAFGVCDGPAASDQNLTSFTWYDAAGEVIADVTPRKGGSDNANLMTCYVYDAQWRVVQVLEDCGNGNYGHQDLVTSYTYDPAGNRLSTSDGLGHVTTLKLDNLGRVLSSKDASGNVEQTQYSLAGEVVATINARGQTNPVTLDRLGRVLSQGFVKADGVTSGSMGYGYDALDNKVSFSDASGQTTVSYDHANRVSTVTAPSATTNSTYFLDGAMKTVSDPSGTTTFSEDRLGRLLTTQDPLNGAAQTRYQIDAAGRLTQRTEANGIVTSAGYSGIDQLVSKAEKAGTSTFASWSATYDLGGNPLTEANVLPGDMLAGTSNFGYDTLNQLATAALPTQAAQAYAYDAAHNRCLTALSSTPVSCTTPVQSGWTSYGYQANESLQSSTLNGSTTTYGSDADGNQLKDAQGNQLKWDSLSRLEQVLSPTGAVLATYVYDALGRLVKRSDGSGNVIQLIYRGLSNQLVQEKDGAGAVLRSYTWDSLGRLLTVQTAGSLYYLLTNLHGDAVGLAQGSGTVAGTVHYDAWGGVLAQSGTQIPIGYQGDWTDPLLGTVRMGVRWYYPKVGRFLSSDPAAGTANPRTPMAGLRWLYGLNSPLRYRDPSGLDACVDDGMGNCVYPDPTQDPTPQDPPPNPVGDRWWEDPTWSTTPSNPCYNDDTGLCGMDAATAADFVNRQQLVQTIDSLQARLAENPLDQCACMLSDHPEWQKQLHDAKQLWDVINDHDAPAQTYLLGFDLAEGHVVIAYGDPDLAEHTAVFVPGGAGVTDPSAANLYAEVKARFAGTSVSTIYWRGYDAPGIAPDYLSSDRASSAALALNSFLSGLRASHVGATPTDLTVIGHSYGSLVVGEAASRVKHFAADNIILTGSPGTGVQFASELHVAQGHVFVAANAQDRVVIGSRALGASRDPFAAMLGRPRPGYYGADPSDPRFGATRLPTGGPDAGHAGTAAGLYHDYFDFDPNSKSLQNMAAIVAGHPGAIV